MICPDAEVDAARRTLAARRRRGRWLPPEVLGEPAWDILLDLLVSAADGVAVPLKSACVAAGVPATTAMRCVDALSAHGLVGIEADPRDRRRKLLVLTPAGERAVRMAVLDAIEQWRGSTRRPDPESDRSPPRSLGREDGRDAARTGGPTVPD